MTIWPITSGSKSGCWIRCKLNEPIDVGARNPLYKPLNVVSYLRKLADPLAGSNNEMTEYFWGLLLTTLNLLRLESLRPQWRKALLSAALVCERLARPG